MRIRRCAGIHLARRSRPDRHFIRRRQRLGDIDADCADLWLVVAGAAGRPRGRPVVTATTFSSPLRHHRATGHRLRDWLTQDRDFLSWRDQIEPQRERWEAGPAAATVPCCRGSALARVPRLVSDARGDVSPPSVRVRRPQTGAASGARAALPRITAVVGRARAGGRTFGVARRGAAIRSAQSCGSPTQSPPGGGGGGPRPAYSDRRRYGTADDAAADGVARTIRQTQKLAPLSLG